MNITDVKIRKLVDKGRMRAVASVTFDDAIAVHDIKVIEGPDRFFVAMPSVKGPYGHRDIAHPINAEAREELEAAVLGCYRETVEGGGPV